MKKLNIFLTAFALLTGFSSCENELDVVNTNNQTTYEFGNNISDLQEAVIACYNRIRLEGTFARVGYTMDAVRGDEVWNSSQQWYLEYDNLNSPGTIDIGDQWIWRDWYHVINRANFMEGPENENNIESLFEVQFMDFGTGGTDQEWTPVNISPQSTQGHAVESNYASQEYGSWGDLAGSPWLYNLYKKERTTDNRLDPRLYWTLVTYEPEYDSYTGLTTAAYPDGDPRKNVVYKATVTRTPLSNTAQGGISIAKFTYARADKTEAVTTGLHCGINIRLMRYSDVLLRAAECENELHGPTQIAIDYINQVRERVALPPLQLDDFPTADHLFEQIANVERPKEFGCENGRGIDLLRWGFFYDEGRLQQLRQHGFYRLPGTGEQPVAGTDELTEETATRSTYDSYYKGHEYFPIFQGTLNANPNLTGNSANKSSDNSTSFKERYNIRPVVNLND